MLIDKDLEGWYEQCLQCSYRYELKILDEFSDRRQAHRDGWKTKV